MIEDLKPTPLLEFYPNQLEAVRKTFNYEDKNKLQQDLDQFYDWIQKQNHFVVRDIDKSYLERFLMANKGSVERAKKRFDRLLTVRNLLPELTKNYEVDNEFEALFRCSHQIILPKPTKDYYRVVISKIYMSDYEGVELISSYRYLFVLLEYLLHHDYNAGYEFVMDAQEMGIGILPKMNPLVVHKAITLVEAYGLRLKCLHFISGSKFFDSVLSILKQGFSEKLKNRIKIYSDVELLCKSIPREILPKEYGGDERSIKELWQIGYDEISTKEHREVLKRNENIVTDETCRLSSKFSEEYSGIPGSFKILSVD